MLSTVRQEIVEIREEISHRPYIPKLIPLKLFLGLILISSVDVTRAMRGRSKRLS